MSCNYAEGLSPYTNKGKLGLAEKFDPPDVVSRKVELLAQWINESNHVVLHTGAGISTSAGIPDFRGPKGVWTLEKKGKKPDVDISFKDAKPTLTHMAVAKLVESGKVQFVISQNIDGLHLRSGVPRKNLAELHGNMFVVKCQKCNRQFVTKHVTSSVGQKCLNMSCFGTNLNQRPCRGKLQDTILDWDHVLPDKDFNLAESHSNQADLSICLGTTLQIIPSGTLPLGTKQYNRGRLVICNLQPTKLDKKADLIINTYVDSMVLKLMELLNLSIPLYDELSDPTNEDKPIIEWTIMDSEINKVVKPVCRNK